MATKAKPTRAAGMVLIRLLEARIRDGRELPAGTEVEVSEQRARIWFEGQVCEYVEPGG